MTVNPRPIPSDLDRRYYTAGTLRALMNDLEARFGMDSEDFYSRYMADESMAVPHFHQHVWASFYREHQELSEREDRFTAAARLVLAH